MIPLFLCSWVKQKLMLTLCLSEEDSEGWSDRRRSSSAGIGHVRDAGVMGRPVQSTLTLMPSAEFISRQQKIQHATVKTWFNNETAAESFTGHIYSKSPPPHCVFDSKPRPLITYTPHQPTAGRRCDDIKSLYSLVQWKLNNTISGFDCRFIWIISIYNFQK